VKFIFISLFIAGILFQLGHGFPYDKGSTTFSSIKMPLSARAQAMGGAGVAVMDDGAYATLNPALISNIGTDNLYLEHINYFQDMSIEFLNATLLYKRFPLGISLEYFNLGWGPITNDVPDYDENNQFHAYDAIVTATTGHTYGKTRVGISLKALREAVWDVNINGAAIDLGVVMPTPLKNLNAGASLINLGRTDDFSSEHFPLTSVLRAGVSYKYRVNDDIGCLAVMDMNAGNDKTLTLPAGLEVLWKSLAVRVGYHLFHDTRTFSAGFGFSFSNIVLDYCYVRYKDDVNISSQPHFFAFSLLF
jgi:hypothetical protein